MTGPLDVGPARGALRPLAPWVAPLALISGWELLARAGVLKRELLPASIDVLLVAVRASLHGGLLEHLGVSALRAFAGLLLGGALGLGLGLCADSATWR